MPLSWNEIKYRALRFSQEWADESSEEAEAKAFLDAFFDVFGVSRRRVATFEQRVKKLDGKDGYIDLLWKGVLLIEHKSRGKNLDRAFQQAKDYFPGIKDRDLPRYVLVSDFARFRLFDVEDNTQHEFSLPEFYQHVHLFGFIAGYQTRVFDQQDPVNLHACERLGHLHDALRDIGYAGHELEVYLVRLLFCLFAENTGIFERRAFSDWISQRTAEDGSDLAANLSTLFQILDTPSEKRLKVLDEQIAAFPYINGQIFTERLPVAAFNTKMRAQLLEAAALDWSRISPAIFGSLFQSVMDREARRQLGAHYTSETNILKLIGPLFLDDLRAEFEYLKKQPKKLIEFQQRLSKLKFFDPACGCGNFLVIAYREIRLLELEVLKALHLKSASQSLDVTAFNSLCEVDQFYGIEIEEFPAQIAQAALWMMDHQMNLLVSEAFGRYFVRLPLKKSPTIIQGNALRLNWHLICPHADFILGNPPFVGKKEKNSIQKEDMNQIFTPGMGVLDYVTCWYRKATEYMTEIPVARCAFVSTNSITQGEQVGILWPDLLTRGVKIQFAHRTFQWASEARGKAAVHCVIIGFGLHDLNKYRLFDYQSLKGEPLELIVNQINPYLIDSENIFLENRHTSICNDIQISYGSFALDNGYFMLTANERTEMITLYPHSEKYIRRFISGKDFLHKQERYCLWLNDIDPSDIHSILPIKRRIELVQNWRKNSQRKTTQKLSMTPTLFAEIRQPDKPYLVFPTTSSENRIYIPIDFFNEFCIASNGVYVFAGATYYHFGILQSTMHMAWTRTVCGRLESRYRYSASIVYNNFPWPDPTDKQKQGIETAGQMILDARKKYPNATLSDLYDPLSMPPELIKAHRRLDALVDSAYSSKSFTGDRERVAFLFERYQKMVQPLIQNTKKVRVKCESTF